MIRNGLLTGFALLSASLLIYDGFHQQTFVGEVWLFVPILGGALGAVALLRGIVWSKYAVRLSASLLLLFSWVSLPLGHPEIPRGVEFWGLWTAIWLLLIGVLFATRAKYDITAPPTELLRQNSSFSFEPRWKEELVCRAPCATFVVELTMGKPHVYFPDEMQWRKSTPPHLHDKWREIVPELERWCVSQNIPLSIVPDAWIHLESEPPANLS